MRNSTPSSPHNNNADHGASSDRNMDGATEPLPLDPAAFDRFCRESGTESRLLYKTQRVLLGSKL